MDTPQKIPASKRFLRSIKTLFLNTVLFPFRIKESKYFLNYVYRFNPLPPLHDNIKEIELEELFPGIERNRVVLQDLENKYGSMTLLEMYSVAALVSHLKPEAVFEFGTFIGVTTLQMALNSENAAKIYTLNLSSTEDETKFEIGKTSDEKNLPDLQPGSRFRNSKEAAKIIQLYGDSAQFDYSTYENKMDFILVDASHEYIYVKSDTENSFRMLKKGGLILWHDYPNSPGVYNYLNEISKDIKIYHIKDTHLAVSTDFRPQSK